MTDTIPQIFDGDGKLVAIDPNTFPPDMRQRYEAVRAAFEANAQADQKLVDANEAVKSALEAVSVTTEYYDAHYPQQTPHDLWKENFGGGPRETMRRHGLVK
jgi:hypothetical protein